MTTATEQMKNDLRRDPEDLAREADNARKKLEGTVDELMQQFAPGELLNRGISFIRNKGDFDFIRNLTSQVENNPIPTVLTGVGLIWLMTASRQAPAHDGARAKESLTDRLGKKAGTTRDKLSSASSSLGSSSHSAAARTRETGHQVAAGASDAMHRVSDAGRNTAEKARSGLHNAREGSTQMLREHPLLIGALAVAAGAGLGSLMARTSAEDRVMGDLSDRGTDALKEKTEDKLHEQQDRASPEIAGSTDESKSSAPSQATAGKPASGASHGDGAAAGTGARRPDPKPPQLDPGAPGTGSDASSTRS